MNFKKIICLLAVVCLAVGLTACGGETKVEMDNSKVVESTNGGFSVETGNYVYFINGVESYSTTYKTGEVTKGALMRVKKSDLAKLGTDDFGESKAETVVSKLIVSGDKTAGFYIYGDYVYYAVPSTEKDTKGNVKSDKLNFFRTKLDGTGTSAKIASEDFSSDASFRFAAKGDKVYLAVYSTSLYVYDAEARKKVYSYEKTIDSLLFDDDNAAELYFTVKPVNENLYDADGDDAKQVSYQEIMRYSFGDDKATVALSGAGKYLVGKDNQMSSDSGAETLTGATMSLLKSKGGKLYFSYTSLDSTVSATYYCSLESGKSGWENATLLNGGDKNASSIFGANSYYYKDNAILYIDSTYGLMKYDYTKNILVSDASEDDVKNTDFGVSVLYYSSDITSDTILGVYGDNLYVYDSSNYFYRIDLTALLNGEEAEAKRINKLAMDTSWYKPEVIESGDKEYLAGVYTDTVYGSYVYAVDIAANEKAYADYLASLGDGTDEFYTSELTSAELKLIVEHTLLGKMTDGDKTVYTNRYDELRKSEN